MTTHVPQEDIDLITQCVEERDFIQSQIEMLRQQKQQLSNLSLARKFDYTETVIRRIIHGGRKA